MMMLFHGSQQIITHPTYGVGSPNNDYGRGFYCTKNSDLAKEWACGKNTDGYCNQYELDTSQLSILNLNSENNHILNWLALLTKHRSYWQRNSIAEQAKGYLQEHFLPDTSGYDIIIGYRADDSYYSFAQDFIMGTISLEKLSTAMGLGALGEQIVLVSENSFRALHYLGNEEALAEEYFIKKNTRDLLARREYRQTKAQDVLQETFILDIMREEMDDNEIRLRSGISTLNPTCNE